MPHFFVFREVYLLAYTCLMKAVLKDVWGCPEENGLGGVSTRVWYAFRDSFEEFSLPSEQGFVESRQIARKHISLKNGRYLSMLGVFVGHNALQERNEGGVRRWKSVSEFSFAVLGVTANSLGFSSVLMNKGLIFFIEDNNGKLWVLGTPKNPAYVASYEAHTGEQLEDDSLVSLVVSAKAPLYEYMGNIWGIENKLGSFTIGFSNGYKV